MVKMVQFSRLPEGLWDKAKARAEGEGRPLYKWLAMAIREKLERPAKPIKKGRSQL